MADPFTLQAPGVEATAPYRAAPVSLSNPRVRALPHPRQWPAWQLAVARLLLIGLVIGLWEASARLGWIDPFFWSSPSAILRTAWVFVRQGTALTDTWFTFRSTLLGFAAGTAAGAVIGLSFWWSRNYARLFEPFVVAFHSMPKLALGPLVILVFGMGPASKVAMAVAPTVAVSILTAYSGVHAVDPDLERLMYSLGASRWQVFTRVVVPSVLPWVVSSLRVNIGLALSGAIVGEFISSQHGLGRLILYAGQTYDIALIWVGVLILSALSMVMYAAVGWLEGRLLRGVMSHRQS